MAGPPGSPLLSEEWQIAVAMSAALIVVWVLVSLVRRSGRGRRDRRN